MGSTGLNFRCQVITIQSELGQGTRASTPSAMKNTDRYLKNTSTVGMSVLPSVPTPFESLKAFFFFFFVNSETKARALGVQF